MTVPEQRQEVPVFDQDGDFGSPGINLLPAG